MIIKNTDFFTLKNDSQLLVEPHFDNGVRSKNKASISFGIMNDDHYISINQTNAIKKISGPADPKNTNVFLSQSDVEKNVINYSFSNNVLVLTCAVAFGAYEDGSLFEFPAFYGIEDCWFEEKKSKDISNYIDNNIYKNKTYETTRNFTKEYLEILENQEKEELDSLRDSLKESSVDSETGLPSEEEFKKLIWYRRFQSKCTRKLFDIHIPIYGVVQQGKRLIGIQYLDKPFKIGFQAFSTSSQDVNYVTKNFDIINRCSPAYEGPLEYEEFEGFFYLYF